MSADGWQRGSCPALSSHTGVTSLRGELTSNLRSVIRDRDHEVDAHVVGHAERAQLWWQIVDDPLHDRLSQMFASSRARWVAQDSAC